MHPQLDAIANEFLEALDRLHRLRAAVPANDWGRRRDPARWSVAECLAHLNLTSAAYLRILDAALAEAKRLGGPAPRRYRRDLTGWLLWKTMGPPVRTRIRTAAAFVPESGAPPEALVIEFERLQNAQMAALREGDGLPLSRVRVVSPFNPRVRYNLYACLSMLPRHQHRHLWQAEQVWGGRHR